MKTFKWTVPEPSQPDRDGRSAAFVHWDRVRTRGFEWYVVNKGLLFVVVLPICLVGYFDFSWSPEMLALCWMGGLLCGGAVWSLREEQYQRSLEDGMQSEFETEDD